MSNVPDRVRERFGDDFQQRDFYSLNTLVDMEGPDSPISKMLEYWLVLKNGLQAAPRVDTFEYGKLWEMKIPNRVTIINCSAEDPADFRIERHAYDVTNDNWIFGERITGQRIGSFPSQMISMAVQTDYQFAKTFQESSNLRYIGIKQRINGVNRDFTRLLLPFAGGNGEISMLVAVTRLRQPKFTVPNF